MKLTTRQQAILDWARAEEHLEVDDIAAQFDVAPQTIRKDINQLCEHGLLRRRYGGVSVPSSVANLSFSSRQVLNQFAKQIIASRLAEMIPENSSVYLGIGTTVEFVTRELSEHTDLKVFTNNLNVASLLCNCPAIDVMVAGGRLRHNDHDVVGEKTTGFFGEFLADYGIIGAGSLDPARGAMDFELEEAQVSRAILNNARRRILVADHSKWDRQALASVAPFSDIDVLITDHVPDAMRPALPASLTVIETGEKN